MTKCGDDMEPLSKRNPPMTLVIRSISYLDSIWIFCSMHPLHPMCSD